MEDLGITPIRTPYQAPNANAYAERFLLSIKTEGLNYMIFFGEASLRRVMSEYVEHYHAERAHQGIGNVLLGGEQEQLLLGPVQCHERLGGILESYSRAA